MKVVSVHACHGCGREIIIEKELPKRIGISHEAPECEHFKELLAQAPNHDTYRTTRAELLGDVGDAAGVVFVPAKAAFYLGDTLNCMKCWKHVPDAGQRSSCPHCGFAGGILKSS